MVRVFERMMVDIHMGAGDGRQRLNGWWGVGVGAVGDWRGVVVPEYGWCW